MPVFVERKLWNVWIFKETLNGLHTVDSQKIA